LAKQKLGKPPKCLNGSPVFLLRFGTNICGPDFYRYDKRPRSCS